MNTGLSVSVFFRVMFFILFSASAFVSFWETAFATGVSWTAQTNAGSKTWMDVTSSSDGTKLVAIAAPFTEYLYTSVDSGVTWTQQTSLGAKTWNTVDSSADGTVIAAGTTGKIYISTDSGANWTERATSRTWSAIALSSDGSVQLAVSGANHVSVSTDGGVTWTDKTNSGVRNWEGADISADGTKMVAIVRSAGYIYTSDDTGETWTAQTAAGSRNWRDVAMSSDGTKLAAVDGDGYVYTSSDGGETWTEQTAAGLYMESVAMSSDGTKVFVGKSTNGVLYSSIDSGVTWIEQSSLSNSAWSAIATSDDGSKTIAVVGLGGAGYPYTATFNYSLSITNANVAYSGNTATFTWTTSKEASSTVLYGLTNSYGQSTSTATLRTSHSMAVTNFNCGNTYHYQIQSQSAEGVIATTSDATFTTGACTPTLSSVSASTTATSATITWTTDVSANSRVVYGLTNSYGFQTNIDYASTTSHSVAVTGLTCETTYHYAVVSTVGGVGGQSATSSDATFTTGVCSTPSISSIAASSGSTDVTITWTTDVGSNSIVYYGLTSAYGSTETDAGLVTSHSVGLSGLTCGVTYHYKVRSENNTASSESGDNQFTTICTLLGWTNATEGTDADGLGWSGWDEVAMSSNGNIIAAAGQADGNIWRSTDAGVSWQNMTQGTAAEGIFWYTVRMTPDGATFVGGGVDGNIWVSTDSGVSWSNKTVGTAAEALDWKDIGVSSNGSVIAGVGVADGNVWVSTDGGDTWNEVTSGTSGTGSFTGGISISSDGTILAVANSGDGNIWISTNGGSTWNEVTSGTGGSGGFSEGVRISSNGSVIAAANLNDGNIWLSTDGGSSWNSVTSGSDASGLFPKVSGTPTMDISPDGTIVAAASSDGDVWLSLDTGATWINITTATNLSGIAEAQLAISSDATKIVVSSYDNLWVSDPTDPTLSSVSATPGSSNATITWTSNLSASSKIVFGLTSSYSTTTSEQNTSTRVTSHSLSLSGLTACTTYHYAVTSRTALTGAATSTDATFTTTGCTSDDEEDETPTRSHSYRQYVGIPVFNPSGLSEAQIRSVLELLQSFSVDAAILAQTTAALRGTSPTPLSVSSPTTPFTRDLKLTMTGEDVRALQVYLNTRGFLLAAEGPGSPGQETDRFGVLTFRALVRFQAAHNLPATGYFGPMTRGVVGK